MKRGLVLVLCLASLSACSGLTEKEQRALSGGAIGAGVGALGMAVLGGPILIGAGIGAVGGAVIGDVTTKK
jgi:hypothetical protein